MNTDEFTLVSTLITIFYFLIISRQKLVDNYMTGA